MPNRIKYIRAPGLPKTPIGEEPGDTLPAVSNADNGKVLGVVNGAWAVKSDSDDFILLRADDEGHVYNGETAITGAQISALAETGKAVFLWDEDGEYLYAFDTVHNGDVYFFAPAFDGNGFYATVVNENDNECSFSARPAIPRASAEDAGKVLTVDSNGAWTKQTPSGSANAVLYTQQTLTPAQQEQARKNISAPAKTVFASLLVPILRECLYGTDQSDALDTLEAALSDQVETFTIQNVLTNVTTSNSAAMIISGAAYHAVLTPDSGTEMVAVTVTMGGVDVTASAYANGVVSISSVTGDVVITATAQSVIDTVTPELIDGYISPTTGTIGGTSSYRHTAVIPVREGDKVYGVCDDSQSGATVNGIPARWTAVYDNNGTFLKDSGVDTQSNYKSTAPYIVPSGVYGVVFSLTNRYANNVVVTIDKSERVVS